MFTITFEQTLDETRGKVRVSKLNLIDLAGSERVLKTGATGQTLKEGAAINKSLAALGGVMKALVKGREDDAHVPFRDSKLTMLLRESLGGNCLTTMLAAVSPSDQHYEETMSTLRYAVRVRW